MEHGRTGAAGAVRAVGFDNLISNNNTTGQSVVTIRSTDKFFEANGCSDWAKR